MQEKTKMTRYCPECGHVGDVGATHINCCPDGSAAFSVPEKYAQELRNGFKALIAAPQCLHQIQEPAAAEQAAWHAGLDEGRAQAAPAAVAVPDEPTELFMTPAEIDAVSSEWIDPGQAVGLGAVREIVQVVLSRLEGRLQIRETAVRAMRAALAATPAAAPVVLPEPALYSFEEQVAPIVGSEQKIARTTYTKFKPSIEHTAYFTKQQLCALLATATGIPAQAVKPSGLLTVDEYQAKYLHIHTMSGDERYGYESLYNEIVCGLQVPAATPQAHADARDDSALLDAMERQRIAVVPEYEGPWDAEVYNDDGKPNHRGSGSTPREAIRAAIAAAKGE